MHVYRMQKLFEAQGKDRVVNVRARASLYQTIERLVRLGLVEVSETTRHRGLSGSGRVRDHRRRREVAREWLREMLAAPTASFRSSSPPLSILFGLAPEEARAELELRAERLAAALAETERR